MTSHAERTASRASKRTTRPQGAESAPNSIVASSVAPVSAEERRARIAEAAYYCSQRRGFQPGGELSDWLCAESEIDAALGAGPRPASPG